MRNQTDKSSPYRALAREWRPQNFAEVVGQKHIITTLVNAIAQKRLGHAYLFTGPRGTGKTTIARVLAKAINCLSAPEPTPKPCGRCDSCRQIMEGNSLDVLEIDGASNTSVEDIRQLRENVKYAPSQGRFKIYIIDEVHMLSKSAFNALLKTLEEPPGHIKFFFATTEPQKIPPTVISRCQRFDLRRIPRELILERLKEILEKEKIKYEEAALLAVAASAEGSMRDAESILDQLLVYSDKKIRLQDVQSLLGLVPGEVLKEFSRAVAAADVTRVLERTNEIFNQGWDIQQFLSALTGHFRDLLVASVTARGKSRPEGRGEGVAETGAEFSLPQLMFILDELIKLEREIKYTPSEKIAVEMTLIKLARSPHRVYIENLLERLKGLEEERAGASVSTNPGGESPGPGKSAGEADPPSLDLERIEEIWPDFMETLGHQRPLLKSCLHEGRPCGFQDGVLTIGFEEEFNFHRESLQSAANVVYLENLLKNKLGFPVKLKFIVASGQVSGSAREPTARPPRLKKKLVNQNPLIKTAIELFDGTIVDVKE